MPTVKLFIQDGNENREYSASEYAQHDADLLVYADQAKAEAVKAVARQSILDRLGITDEEAALLFL